MNEGENMKNAIRNVYPKFAEEWHPIRNGILTAENTTYGSTKDIWWMCKDGHEWVEKPKSRNRKMKDYNKSICQICTGRKAKDNNLADKFPELMKEWNYPKNTLNPNITKPYSHKYAWWKCIKCANEWKAQIHNRTRDRECPKCKNSFKSSFPEHVLFYYFKKQFPDTQNRYLHEGVEIDIYIPSLHIGIEYDGHYHKKKEKEDEEKNFFLNKHGIKLFRIRCKTNQLTLPKLKEHGSTTLTHDLRNNLPSLEECINTIIRESKIKFEFVIDIANDNTKIRKEFNNLELENSLAIKFPVISEQWNYEKNENLLPEFFSPFSNVVVWWKCYKNAIHTWPASISNRTNQKSGCPYCDGKKLSIENSLAVANPYKAEFWHDTKNGEITPYDITRSSSDTFWWKCGSGHEWEDTVNSHVSNKYGCPKCYKINPTRRGRSKTFSEIFPEHILDWDYSKNIKNPNKLKSKSHEYVWWKCSVCNNEWKTQVRDKKECPKCRTLISSSIIDRL